MQIHMSYFQDLLEDASPFFTPRPATAPRAHYILMFPVRLVGNTETALPFAMRCLNMLCVKK